MIPNNSTLAMFRCLPDLHSAVDRPLQVDHGATSRRAFLNLTMVKPYAAKPEVCADVFVWSCVPCIAEIQLHIVVYR